MNRAKSDSSKRRAMSVPEPGRIKRQTFLLKELAWLGAVAVLVFLIYIPTLSYERVGI